MPGGNPDHLVPTGDAGRRLHDYLKDHLIAVPVRDLGALVKDGSVARNGRRAMTDERLAAGDVLTWDRGRDAALRAEERWIAPTAGLPLRIVHEDSAILIVDKPAGMHVHPLGAFRTATLANALVWHAGARPESPWGAWRPHSAHRLDRPASGLLVIAKSGEIRDALRRAFEEGTVRRTYLAIVAGSPREDRGTIDAAIGVDPAFNYRRALVPIAEGGQSAITHWRVVGRAEATSRLELEIETGRTHQIRVHLASLGHPIIGDTLYADAAPPDGGQPGESSARVIALHAVGLELVHPLRGEKLRFECLPPADWP